MIPDFDIPDMTAGKGPLILILLIISQQDLAFFALFFRGP
jgi:hypothetical protein